MMNAFLLSTPFLLGFSMAVTADSNDSRTCDITPYGPGTTRTVPQFCLRSSLLNSGKTMALFIRLFPHNKLNFTSTILREIPENRERIKIEEDHFEKLDMSPGWANFANGIVSIVSRRNLPYDAIIPYLKSTVKSPITSQCGVNETSETGDASLGDLLDEVMGWWTPIIVMTAVGPVLAIIFITVAISFCCCRLCGKCNGRQSAINENLKNNCCFKSYFIVLACLMIFSFSALLIGLSFIIKFNSNRNFDGIIDDAINNVTSFIGDTKKEMNITLERYDEVNSLVECEINNIHISIGGGAIEMFESAVRPLIDSSLILDTQMDASINALAFVNITVAQLQILTKTLQIKLNDITAQTILLRTMCVEASGIPATVCNMIPNSSYSVVMDYSAVDDVSTVLATLQQVSDIGSQALQANNSFYAIPCDIKDQILTKRREILDKIGHFQLTIAGITADVEGDLNDILDEDNFIGAVRNQSSNIQDVIDEYSVPIYVIIAVMYSLTSIVIFTVIIMMMVVLLACVAWSEDSGKIRCAITTSLIMIGLLFGLTVILLILSSIAFFFGANLLRLCYSIAEDPPHDLPSYELYSRIVDNNELWGGYLLGCLLLENSSIPLTVTGILNGCKDNGALYQVALLDQRYKLDLENALNISRQIPNLDDLFNDLENKVKFNRNQILTEDTAKSLQDYADAGLQGINYSSYTAQTRSIISTLNVTELILTMEDVRTSFIEAGHSLLVDQTNAIIEAVQRVKDITITEIIDLTDTLEAQILMLNNTASQLNANVDDIISQADLIFDELQNSSVVINESRKVLDRIIFYTNGYTNWTMDNLKNKVGQCQPLYSVYHNVYFDVCESAVNGINGFWLAIGWFVLLSIPTIVVAIRIVYYLKPVEEMEVSQSRLNLVELMHMGSLDDVASATTYPTGPDLSLPDFWDEQPIGTDNKIVICHLVTVPHYTREYEEALVNFKIELPSEMCQIIELTRVQNPNMYQQYSLMRAQMQQEVHGSYEVESQLFHGTSKEACDQINHQGFNRAYAGKNATCYGRGVNFAVSAEFSFRDCYSKIDEDGYKYIYICLVLTGEYTRGEEDMIVPPPKNPDQSNAILYHSVVDNKHSPEIFVVFKDYQAYPQYLVKCRDLTRNTF